MAERWSHKELAPRLGGGVRRVALPQLRPSGPWPITWLTLELKLLERTPELSNPTLWSCSLLCAGGLH